MIRRRKFNYEAFGNALNIACVEQVRKSLSLQIPLTAIQIFRIVNALRKFDRNEAKRYLRDFRAHYKISRNIHTEHVRMVSLDPRAQWVIVMAIEAVGREKEDFEIARYLIRWYGIERSRVKVFKEFIPRDPRPGLYDGNEYDGIGRTGFTLDNVGLLPEDQVKMENWIEHNKWSKDQLRIT